jgi:hypothetical protein
MPASQAHQEALISALREENEKLRQAMLPETML